MTVMRIDLLDGEATEPYTNEYDNLDEAEQAILGSRAWRELRGHTVRTARIANLLLVWWAGGEENGQSIFWPCKPRP